MALGITVIVFGISETLHGYGFVSVFVSGLALRAAERDHEYDQTLHDFSEQLERLLMMVPLVLFGDAVASGELIGWLTWVPQLTRSSQYSSSGRCSHGFHCPGRPVRRSNARR